MYDIIIIGGGPAGLTAALYARRANKSVLILEKAVFGGQITYSPRVENIPGFSQLTGNEFAEKLVDQVISQGAEVEPCEVSEIRHDAHFTVVTDGGDFAAMSVIIATGAKHRLLGVPGEEKFIGDGVSFCAVCDGAFYRGKTVGVVGGGNSALQEALLLSELAAQVIIFQNLDYLTGEQKLVDQVKERSNIRILTGVTVTAMTGDTMFEGIAISYANGEKEQFALDGVFLAVGLVPQNEMFASFIELDARGYALSDENCLTKTPGIYVAGDCRTKNIRQVTTAAADGAVAALAACNYIDNLNAQN